MPNNSPQQQQRPDDLFRRPKRGDLDEEFAQRYFTLLVGQYKTMGEMVNDPAARDEANAMVTVEEGELITWERIYRLELAILKLEPLESLCRKAWILREEYQEVANVADKVQYAASNPPKPDPATVKESELRADLVKIQEELNWAYTVLWIQESFRSQLTYKMIWGTVLVSIIFGAAILGFGLPTCVLLLTKVSFAGMLGGCISTLRRIQSAKLDGNSDLNLVELERGELSIFCSPLLGAVFALILCALFASGLVDGVLFPKFTAGASLCGCFNSLDCAAQAKLLAWSFLAGFAEQLVPDRLDQLTKGASTADKDKKSP